MRMLPASFVLGATLLFAACGGDDSAPPPAKTLVPAKPGGGGKGGASGKGGSAGGAASAGSSAGNGQGGSQGGGNQGGGNQGGSGNAGGSSGQGGGAASAGSGAGGNGQGGGAAASGSTTGGQGGSQGGGSQGGGGGDAGAGGAIEGKCTSKVDCDQYPNRPLCNLEKSICVECLASADCGKDPERKVCDTSLGQCVQCLSESDCAGHPDGPHCDLKKSRCTCLNNAECAGSSKGKLCDVDGLQRCAECISAFDCKDPQKPGCSLDDVCFKGDFCAGDDAEEAGDDGPLGALDVTPEILDFPEIPPWTRLVENRHICDLPVEENDWYKFKIEARDSYELSLEWDDAEADLDLVVIDSQNHLYGYDYFGRPAKVFLTYLPAGTLYAFVYRAGQFDKLSTTPTPYRLRVTRLPEAGKCLSTVECASAYNTQLYRGVCNAIEGTCSFIEGGGNLGNGQGCDDDKDCKGGRCSYQPFTKDAHARSFCTTSCAVDPCPGGQRCASYLVPEQCITKCSDDQQCHVSTSTSPPDGATWFHLTCNKDTGDCE